LSLSRVFDWLCWRLWWVEGSGEGERLKVVLSEDWFGWRYWARWCGWEWEWESMVGDISTGLAGL